MAEEDLNQPERRLAIAASLTPVDAGQAAEIIRQFLEGSPASVREWDQKFLDLVRRSDGAAFFSAETGDGIRLLFSPERGTGCWLMDRPSRGPKGFLSGAQVAQLGNLADQARETR